MLAKLKQSTMWLMAPTLVVAVLVGLAVSGYEPLVFNPALAQEAQAAQAAQAKVKELKDRDAKDEKTGEKKDLGIGTPAPAEAVRTAAAPPATGLADGTYTGYAPCGEGNVDNWKPYYVAVTILVEGGKVARITDVSGSATSDSGGALAWDPAENQTYLDWASSGRNGNAGVTDQINSALAAEGSVSGIDTVSSATYSSVAIYNAYVAAVNKAASAGGNKNAASQTPAKAKNPANSSNAAAKKSTKKAKEDSSASEVASKSLADGTWVGYAACGEGNEEEWSPYYVVVTVTVKGGKVQSVTKVSGSSAGEAGNARLNWKEAENAAYLKWAAEGRTRGGVAYAGVLSQINDAIAAGKYPSSIDTVSGATYSSEAIFKAFYAALKKSAAAGGTTVSEPSKSPASPDPKDPTDGGNSGASDNPGNSGAAEDPGNTDGPGSSGGDNPSDANNPGGDNPGSTDNPGGSDEPELVTVLVDGTYTGHAFCQDQDDPRLWSPYYMLVDIVVSDGVVTSVTNARADSTGEIDSRYAYDASENSTYLNAAINGIGKRIKGMVAKMQDALDAGLDPAAVDVVSSATWSSKAIVDAYSNAVANVPETTVEANPGDGGGEG